MPSEFSKIRMPRHGGWVDNLLAAGTQSVSKVLNIERGEYRAVALSAAYFFFLLCGYYIIRPIREEMGVLGGVENLQWLFTGTFIVIVLFMPLFGWTASRFPRRRFLPWVYGFFILHLLLFYAALKAGYSGPVLARSFFIWTSVFNLFVVSVFWSFMADIFRHDQAKRLFPSIAAGGTLGAIAGPLITTLLVRWTGTANLLLLSALLLSLAVFCIRQLGAGQPEAHRKSHEVPMGGGMFDGFWLLLRSRYLLAICVVILLYSTLGTFLYFQQAEIVRDSFSDSSTRTAMFSSIDLAVNILTLVFQIVVTGRIIKWIGLAGTLAAIPILLAAGFAALGSWPGLAVLFTVQIIRRAGDYAIMRPAREMLFVVLSRQEKYKAKNFIDTSVCRGGDAVSAWGYAGLGALGLSLAQIAWLAVPLALLWAAIGYRLGIHQHKLAYSASRQEPSHAP
jgi:ATP:ADP antiporter, AAA family